MKIGFATMLLAFLLVPQLSFSQTSENKRSTDGLVQVDGSSIYYQECGSGPSAVVLMHDGVVDSAVWNDVWPSFCKEFHAIRYDRRGRCNYGPLLRVLSASLTDGPVIEGQRRIDSLHSNYPIAFQ